MKKVFKKIRSIKLPSSLLIFLAIFVVSIFGLQVSKMYAQNNSFLSSTLGVQGGASIGGPLTVSGGMGVGSGAPGSGLSVAGGGYFDGVVYTADPVSSQSAALATVYYVQSKVASIPACPTCPACPACPACNSCCGGSTNPPGEMDCLLIEDFSAPCDGLMPRNALGEMCVDSFYSGYDENSCNSNPNGYWMYKCCPFLPRI